MKFKQFHDQRVTGNFESNRDYGTDRPYIFVNKDNPVVFYKNTPSSNSSLYSTGF